MYNKKKESCPFLGQLSEEKVEIKITTYFFFPPALV